MEMANYPLWSLNMLLHGHQTFYRPSTFASKLRHNSHIKEQEPVTIFDEVDIVICHSNEVFI